MNARELVNRLLEAEPLDSMEGVPGAAQQVSDRTGVYIFGPYLPDKGYAVPSMEQAIKDFEKYGFIRKGGTVDQVMNYLTGIGYTFILKKEPGNIEVIGRVPVHTSTEGQRQAAQYLGLDRQQQVQHRANYTATPKALDVDYVLYGSKELERSRREQEKEAKEKRTVQTQQLGKIDPQEQQWKEPPTGVGYSGDIMPINAPVEVGFVYKEMEEGLRVEEVVPGGPAAQAGLQAGDVVYGVHPFNARDSGEPVSGPRGKGFDLNQGKHLEYVLRKADPNQLLSFRVYRGDQPINVPIQPQVKPEGQPERGGQEMHIPGEEVRQYFQTQRPRAKRTGPYQRTFTRKLKVRPNEPTPAATTGNEPANVSSIT